MLKALFVHSHRFITLNNKIYTTGTLRSAVWERYLYHFDELVVLGRLEKMPEPSAENLEISSKNSVKFELLEYLNNPADEYIYNRRIRKDIETIIKKYKINAVIARVPSEISFNAVKVCVKLSIPFALEIVGCPYDAISNYRFQPWYNLKNLAVKILAPIARKQMQCYVSKAPFSIYVTERFLQNRYPPKKNSITTHASNVDLPDFKGEVLEARKRFLTEDSTLLKFGMIGNLDVIYKGYDISLKALARLKNTIPDFKLYIIGGGKGEAVRKLAEGLGVSDNVIFMGKLRSGDPVYNFLDQMNIYLHPSLQEGLPRSLIEAMSRGCPCLGSDTSGIPELLRKKYIHRAGNHKELARQILEVVNSKVEQIEMAEINFHKAKEYTSEILANRRYQFWKQFSEDVKKKYK